MVIVHPEYAKLILEVNDLIEQIANLVVERDMLKFYICKDIEMDYMLKIGALEYKLLIAGNSYKRNVRKLELIQEKISKKAPVNLASIEKKLNTEFKKSNQLVVDMSENLDLAVELASVGLYDSDILEEMNLDYFKLQKLYNPIFDLNLSEDKAKMYKKVESYYKKGNYKKLHKMAEKYDDDEVFLDEIVTLKRLYKKYADNLQMVQREIRKIKNSFPYNQKLILEDENLYRRKKDSLNREITELNIENKKIEKKIEKKLKEL